MKTKMYKSRNQLISKSVYLLILMLISSSIFAQSPEKMSYQSVIRDASGNLITEAPIGMQISILQTTQSGTAVYVETQTPTTNSNGLVSVEIGEGSVVSGDFTTIDWADGPYFIKTEIAVEAPLTTYTITGVSQLLSVPYALHAKTAENLNGNIDYSNISNVPSNVSAFNNDALYLTPAEYQDLELNGSTLTITHHPSPTEIDLSPYMGTNTDEQTLSIVGDELSITNGNTVTLPQGNIWLKDGSDVYYNDMNDGQSKLYFHPNGNMSYNTTADDAKFSIFEDNESDTTTALSVHTQGGSSIFGNSTAKSNSAWMNVGVNGNVHLETGTSGTGIRGTVFGEGNGGYAVRGEAQSETGWNTGLSGVALSRDENNSWHIGGEFSAQGDWNPANGAGTGNHYGIRSSATGAGLNVGVRGYTLAKPENTITQYGGYFTAYGEDINNSGTGTHFGTYSEAKGGGDWSVGTWSQAAGTSPTGNNFGGQFTGTSQVETNGFHYGIRAEADSSNYINRGVVGIANTQGQYNFGALFQTTGQGHPAENTVNYGVYGTASNNRQQNYGVLGTASATENTDITYLTAVYGEVWDACSEISNIGVDGTVHSTGETNIGVGGFAHGPATNVDDEGENKGVWGFARNADINYAVYAQANYSGGLVNYGIYAEADSATNENHAGFFEGDVTVTGDLEILGNVSKGGGTFKIDHPLDPENKYLVHSFVESPEMMNVYSGNITTDANGFATVELPNYFEAANKDFRYQLTCIGTFAQAIVKEEIANNNFLVQTNEPNVKISWQVTAVRNDKYAEQNRIVPEQIKNEREKGKYLHPEAYGKHENQRVYKRVSNNTQEILEQKNKAHTINKAAAQMNKEELDRDDINENKQQKNQKNN